MSNTTSTIVLWLFVVNLGIAFGAGLQTPNRRARWISSSPESGAHWNAEAARRTTPDGGSGRSSQQGH